MNLGKCAGHGYGQVTGGIKMQQKRKRDAHNRGEGQKVIPALSSKSLTVLRRKTTRWSEKIAGSQGSQGKM